MNLYFQHSNGTVSLVSADATQENVFKLINQDVESRNKNFNIYYIRSWTVKDITYFDVGSWSEYYLLTNQVFKEGERIERKYQ